MSAREWPNQLHAACILDCRVVGAAVMRQSYGFTGLIQNAATGVRLELSQPFTFGSSLLGSTGLNFRAGYMSICRTEPAANAGTDQFPNFINVLGAVPLNTLFFALVSARTFANVSVWPAGIWQILLWRQFALPNSNAEPAPP